MAFLFYKETMKNFNFKGFQFPKTDAEKVRANVEAVALVKELEKTQQQATAEQQAVLAKYVGWGGLANVFFDRYAGKFEEERTRLENLVTPTEYQAMQKSSLTAYYTDTRIVEQMWDYLIKNGFKGGNILDPSMATGIFFGTMPKEIQENSTLVGVELDTISGLIAKQLFPEATILIQGFETVEFDGKPFDLIMTNVPFSEFRISDTNYEKPYVIHDYFLRKSVDLLNENGVIGFVTSMGTANKRSNSILKEIKDEVAFLGGVRLPSSAFKELAGTKVSSDILFFEKDRLKTKSSNEIFFEDAIRSDLDKEGRVFINPYFENNQVLGDYEIRYFNGATLSVKPWKDSDLFLDIKEGLSSIYAPTFAGYSVADVTILSKVQSQSNVRPYEYGFEDGKVVYHNGHETRILSKGAEITFYQDANGKFVSWDKKHGAAVIEDFEALRKEDKSVVTSTYISPQPSVRGANKGLYKGVYFYEKPLEDKEVARVKGMIAIKEAYQSVIDIQSTDDYDIDEFQSLLTELNETYDMFVKEYGYINTPVNTRLFERDDRFPLIASLEEEALDDNDSSKVVFEKAKAFFEPTIRPKKSLEQVDSAEKALSISLSEGRGVDLDFMITLYPAENKEVLLAEIFNEVAPNIQKYSKEGIFEWELKTDLLSGDVVTKKELLELLVDKGDTKADWEYYLSLINEVVPEPVTMVDMEFNIGSMWIPNCVLGKFAYQILDGYEVSLDSHYANKAVVTSKIGRGLTHDFVREVEYSAENIRMGLRADGAGAYSKGHAIFERLLGSNQPTIEKTVIEDGKEKKVVNEVATAELREVERKMQKLFLDFVENNEDVKELVEATFNKRFNRIVNKKYDGSHLHIEGLAQGYELRPHQLNAVQRILEDKRALLAHEVGTGKTLTMVSAGFKLKELGLINKPLYVVPSSLTAQFGQEILRFYPTKKVFVTSERDFEKSRRKLFISRIASNNYDAIVIGHSQFEKIKVSEERQLAFYQDRLDEVRSIMAYAESEKDRVTFKQTVRMEARLEKQIEKLDEGKLSKADSFVEFEQLGIDFLFVDEAHRYKNVRPVTNLGNVAGIGNTTAQKNMDMEMKIRSLQEEHNGTNIVFATGTPVSNSISEMYVMMNYIQPDILSEYGMDNFDAWVGAFGVIENNLEINTTGDKFIARKRFTKFTNLPELMKLYKRTTDIQMTEDLDLPVPDVERIAVKSDMTDTQTDKLDELVERTDKIKTGSVDPADDNMLKITSEARKLATDMRLLDTSYTLADNNKIMQVVDNVFKIYQRETINRGTQMIFSDIGTPSTDGFSIYSELKNLLVDRGVPEEEIAFIHDAKNKDAKLQLQRKMNAGEVRILLASTEKGGTGLNVQRRMKAVHHIDVPWKPSDIIQRNGRIVRQGNLYNRVQIYYYITTGSFDNYLWQIQETKLRYISQIMTSSTPVRSASDIDEQAMTASDFKAIATGNPFLKMRIELENELDLLSKRKVAWKRDFELSQKSVKSAQERIEATNRQLSKIDLDIEQANATKKEEVTIGEEKIVKNPFVMEFTDGYTTESTFKAGNQLAYTMQFNVSETTKFVTLAKYRGFELKALTLDAPYRQGKALALKVVGKNMYTVELDFTSPVGTIQRINNVIDSLDKTKIRLEQLVKNQQLIIDKGIADSVFADEERLAYVKAKYEVLLPLLNNDASVEEIEKALEEFSKQYGSEDKSVNVLDKYLEVSQDDVEEIQLLEPQNETVEVPSEEDSERPEREEDNSDKLKLALQFLADAELLLGQADEPTEVVFTSETTITVCEQLELF